MNDAFAVAVQKLLGHLQSGSPRTVIALAGIPGSGKSTLAARLAAEVNAQAGPGIMTSLGMDGFHVPLFALRQMPDPEEVLARRGSPWTFNDGALAMRLQQLREADRHQAIGWPEFQHDVGDPVEDATFVNPEVRLVLVEGLYLLTQNEGWSRVSAQFDEKWYLDVPLDIAMERLAQRHMAAWAVAPDEAERRIAVNDRLNAEIVLASRENANWILR